MSTPRKHLSYFRNHLNTYTMQNS